MNYLSFTNTPEMNLQLIAQHQTLLTEPVEVYLEKRKRLEQKCFQFKILFVFIAAVGMILGMKKIITIGFLANSIAWIPLIKWQNFKMKLKLEKNRVNNDLTELDQTYQNMIDALQVRSRLIKLSLQPLIEPQLKAKKYFSEETFLEQKFNQEVIEPSIKALEEEYLANLDLESQLNCDSPSLTGTENDLQVDVDDEIKLNENSSVPNREDLRLLKDCQADLKFKIADLIQYTSIITNLHLQTPILSKKWLELKQVCQAFSRPYSSYFKVNEANYLVFQEPIENELNDSTL